MPSCAGLLAGALFGLVCVLGGASTATAAREGSDVAFEDVFGGLVSNAGPGTTQNVIEVIEQDGGGELQLADVMGRIGRAASEGPLRAPGGGLNSLLNSLVMLSRRKTPPPRRHTPKTVVGGILLPLFVLCVVTFYLAKKLIPDATASLLGRVFGSKPAVHAFAFAEVGREAAVRHGVTLQGVTRVFVSLYFVHEGSAAFQVKFEQFHDSLIPIMTPFGPMHMVPPWQKVGDALLAHPLLMWLQCPTPLPRPGPDPNAPTPHNTIAMPHFPHPTPPLAQLPTPQAHTPRPTHRGPRPYGCGFLRAMRLTSSCSSLRFARWCVASSPSRCGVRRLGND